MPPPVDGILKHLTLFFGATGQVYHAMVPEFQVERFFGTNTLQGTAIRAIAAFGVSQLIYDGSGIYQPGDEAGIGQVNAG